MKKFEVGEYFRPKEGKVYIAVLPDGREIPVVAVIGGGCVRCPLRGVHYCWNSCNPVMYYRLLEETIL